MTPGNHASRPEDQTPSGWDDYRTEHWHAQPSGPIPIQPAPFDGLPTDPYTAADLGPDPATGLGLAAGTGLGAGTGTVGAAAASTGTGTGTGDGTGSGLGRGTGLGAQADPGGDPEGHGLARRS